MGVASARCAQAEDAGHPAVDPNADKPYFFLASCPEEQLNKVLDLTDRYGGFNSFSGTGPTDTTNVSGKKDDEFAAWKGRAEGQLSTLKRLAKPGQNVFGIAIAGFGRCNKEREFLSQLAKRKGHEQFQFKQCGDAADMERWLQSEGYQQLVMESRPVVPDVGDTQVGGVFASMATMASMAFGGDPEAARRERLALDVLRITEDSFEVDEMNVQSLQEAKDKLSQVVEESRNAGVLEEELSAAESRISDLVRQIKNAQERKGFCVWLPCCYSDAKEWKTKGEVRLDSQLGTHQTNSDATLQEDRLRALEVEVEERQRHVEMEKKKLQMRTVLPAHVDANLRLKPGTKCRYNSSRVSKWLSAVVEGYNTSDNTYNLDVRQHAKLDNISPASDVKSSEAWPNGICVEYESSTAGNWLEATIQSFNEGKGGKDGTYNLDVRQHAPCDRIKLRIT